MIVAIFNDIRNRYMNRNFKCNFMYTYEYFIILNYNINKSSNNNQLKNTKQKQFTTNFLIILSALHKTVRNLSTKNE